MRITLEPLNAGHAPEMFPVLSDPAIYTHSPGAKEGEQRFELRTVAP